MLPPRRPSSKVHTTSDRFGSYRKPPLNGGRHAWFTSLISGAKPSPFRRGREARARAKRKRDSAQPQATGRSLRNFEGRKIRADPKPSPGGPASIKLSRRPPRGRGLWQVVCTTTQ